MVSLLVLHLFLVSGPSLPASNICCLPSLLCQDILIYPGTGGLCEEALDIYSPAHFRTLGRAAMSHDFGDPFISMCHA
jgi:hypothetical protein